MRYAALSLALVLFAALSAPASVEAQVAFDRSALTIETAGGQAYPFDVEVARTRRQLAQGLMFRRELAADAGMLFFFGPPQRVSMWMKNTLIPLDMLFIAEDGRIATIAERTVPLSTATISSQRPVVAVLELNGGTAQRLGIAVGDRIVHPAFDG